jgi:hypothetical protein
LAHRVCDAKFRKKKPAGKTVDVPDYDGPPKPASDPEGPEEPDEEPPTVP